MPRPKDPAQPDLSRTFWTPDFPGQKEGVVRRAHPPPRWGDYNITTGLYIWQNRRCEDRVTANHRSKIERALKGMWYGVENNPRCNHCEEKDRACTRTTNVVYGGAACARCRIDPERKCSFAHGRRRTLGHKRRRPVVQDDSDDYLPVKTILSRRRTNDKHDVNIREAQPETIEIPESPKFSSPGGHARIEERLRALEADNYRYQAEKRQDRDRVLELELQISLLKEQQERKLKQEIRELRKMMNHAINQTI